MIVNYLMVLLFFLSAVMSRLETDRYGYSNSACCSRDEGGEIVSAFLMFTPTPTTIPVSLAGNFCFATIDREECLRLCQKSIGAGLVSAHAFFCVKCHEATLKTRPFAFIAQASVEMDRYRGLCCWYTSITILFVFVQSCTYLT